MENRLHNTKLKHQKNKMTKKKIAVTKQSNRPAFNKYTAFVQNSIPTKISIYSLLFICIFLLGIYFRFINIPNRYQFDGDAIRDAIVAYQGARSLHFPLIGAFSSKGPFTFGPWYWDSIILASFIYPSVYSPWLLMGLTSLISIILMFDIGRKIDSKKFGLILSLITAIIPSQISSATDLSNLAPVHFFSILSLWIATTILYKKKNSYGLFLFLGISLGLGINAHYQMLGLLPLPIFIWLNLKQKKIMQLLLVLFGLCVTFIPLLLFNIYTHGQTIHGLESWYYARGTMYFPNSWKIYLLEFWPSFLSNAFGTPPIISIVLFASFFVFFIRSLIRREIQPMITILVSLFAINFIVLRFYWEERLFVYLYYVTPVLILFFGYFFMQLFKFNRIFFIIIITLLTIYIIRNDYKSVMSPSEKYVSKQFNLLQKIYPNNRFIFYSCNKIVDINAEGLGYLSIFIQQNKQPLAIGVIDETRCPYPNLVGYDFSKGDDAEKYATKFYPRIDNLQLTNFSIASPSAMQKASWIVFDTKKLYKNTIEWWK